MAEDKRTGIDGKAKPKKAVALGYGKITASAPKVLAKGERLTAERILEIAREMDIAIHEDERLVEALFSLEIGEEIPEKLYRAVATVLAYIYRKDGIEQRGN